ncbi:carboxypeptidase-like regulatory domain-containing protein [Carboxylicivirga marina]|uniref:Carboxypeptidase-like regulatory domain-containing protein n=1 Tax=Carboxylicivirga marina TaxID=2800988 RepID=A0ABS1HIY5_9BACT|nr:carboxypeptidase-like regulatory domain-containing protein [Carboxylicivirga marina]MBK3517643.1 carboxypeptidase-like regulatory domain-containing protein [Carboxylicivirga marina]
MKNKKQHKANHNSSDFLRYLNKEMSTKEAHNFERNLLNDDFEADALEGLASLNDNTLSEDLNILSTKITRQKRKQWKRPVFYAAASVIMFFGIISTLWLFLPNNPVMVSESTLPIDEPILKKQLEEQTQPADIRAEKGDNAEADIVYSASEPPSTSVTPDNKEDIISTKRNNLSQPLTTKKEFEIDREEELRLQIPNSRSSISRVEQEVMSVDYGTLEGGKIRGYASKSKSDELMVIRGKVADKNNKPLPGASIQLQGTELGTIANNEGHYQMYIPASDSSRPVNVSYAGFMPQETTALTRDSINFLLEEEYATLSEVITIEASDDEKKKVEEFIHASPIGGLDNYIEKIEENLRYPKNGTGKKEHVVLIISINHRGDIKNIEIKRSPGENYSIETIRAIRNGVNWQPATDKGFPVEDSIKLKLRFTPPEK